ncbi:MAG: protease HtpX [Alphaproteobacteria bacterium CG_4_10_14_0_2_um_filter_63_37]|nr:MAG: zinc metalloprotease HtpX [Proteobacteria bacterium CG1_02_64_396]PJA23873.1 MAG: protease HtpX [Alphaproteobacteria bacterium CG_4_10_14_0_2_um_filter_63_37]
MKRILLFLATNLAIVIVLSITMQLLGVEPYLNQNGLNLQSLLIFSFIFGMGGSFISLAISKWSAKRMTGAVVIEQPQNEAEAWLVRTVQRQAQQAGIGMPEVAIYDAPDPNAFATGMSRNSSLVAVSTGLLRSMDKEAVEAVLAHEISHIANGDMVTLTLIQGVVNTFVIFFSRVIGNFVDKVIFKNERGQGAAFWVTTILAEIVLGILASIIVMWFSRQREFRADAGSARLVGAPKMVAALQALQRAHEPAMPNQMTAMGISGKRSSRFGHLFLSHPPLEERIAALRGQGAAPRQPTVQQTPKSGPWGETR